MARYVILSRISPQAFDDPKDFKALAKDVSEKIKRECPGVTWKESFATLGRFDVVDIVDASDPKEVEKAAMIIRAYGHASTSTFCVRLGFKLGRGEGNTSMYRARKVNSCPPECIFHGIAF